MNEEKSTQNMYMWIMGVSIVITSFIDGGTFKETCTHIFVSVIITALIAIIIGSSYPEN